MTNWLAANQEIEADLEDSGVLWIRLNRPKQLNAVTISMLTSLQMLIEKLNIDPAVKVVVLTANGRAFCAGADLIESGKRNQKLRENVLFIRKFAEITTALENSPKPIICVINGIATAGGLELALACDVIIASDTAKIGDCHANYAVFPGAGMTVRLPRKIGLARAKSLMFSGNLLNAEDAYRIGLIEHIAEENNLHNYANDYALNLARKSPLVIERMKSCLNSSIDSSLDDAIKRERDVSELHALSEDRKEGLAAFKEKRIPVYKGS